MIISIMIKSAHIFRFLTFIRVGWNIKMFNYRTVLIYGHFFCVCFDLIGGNCNHHELLVWWKGIFFSSYFLWFERFLVERVTTNSYGVFWKNSYLVKFTNSSNNLKAKSIETNLKPQNKNPKTLKLNLIHD